MTLLALAVLCAAPKVDISVRADRFPEVDVIVNARDPATGESLYDLKQTDFKLNEDGFVQTVSGFNVKEKGKVDPIDIVFVFDETGSMQDEIDAVRDNSIKFADALKKLKMDFRLALVTFSDQVEKVKDFTADAAEFKGWLAELKADGGDDEPENPLDALAKATEFKFRPGAKVVFILVTDATFHTHDAITKRELLPLAKDIKLKGIDVYPIALDFERYRWLARETNGTYFPITESFSKVLDTLAVKLTAQYKLTYTSTSPGLDNSWRVLEVSAKDGEKGSGRYKAKAQVKVSSMLVEKDRPADAYGGHNIVDGDSATAWNEGSKGDGVGDWVQFDFDKPVVPKSMNMINGYTKTTTIFKANPRVKTFKVTYSDGTPQTVTVKDSMAYQEISFDRTTPTTSIKLEITEIYKGKVYHDCAISEIDFTFRR